MGLKIPEDISIIGYAGLNYTQLATPSLTTVKQPFIKMGAKAAEILIGEVMNKTSIQEVRLPVELIVRESTASINNSVNKEVEYTL